MHALCSISLRISACFPQVVIPEEEEPAAPLHPPPVEVEVAVAPSATESDSEISSKLSALAAETEIFGERVAEAERLLRQGGAPALLELISRRLTNLSEQLTRHHLEIDALEIPRMGNVGPHEGQASEGTSAAAAVTGTVALAADSTLESQPFADANDGEGARSAKRELTRRVEALCERVDALIARREGL
eukprot:6203386-Pleurochrysis_carterae.AAC.2